MEKTTIKSKTQGIKGGKFKVGKQGAIVIEIADPNKKTVEICVDSFTGYGDRYQQRENALINIDFGDGVQFSGDINKLKNLLT